jgi:hypothetical protein
MAEKVAKLGVNREKDFMYYVKDGAVWKVQRKQPGVPKGRPEKVADGGVEMDTNSIGGQKRKKKGGTKKAASKAPKKSASKKAASKGKKASKKAGGKKKAKKKGRR